jgi:hypothetical protein
MFYKHDIGMLKILLAIKQGLHEDFDYPLIVSGDTGKGKSHLILHLLEVWQRLLGKEVTSELISQMHVDRMKWLKKFKELEPLDINIFDEGANGLGSKQYAEKFSKTLEMLFQVIRKKRFFTVIIIPNFFRLNKYFREDRLRGMIYVDKRGFYRFYTRKQIVRLCQINDRRPVKNMNVVRPFHTNKFPKYKGILLDAYNEMAMQSTDDLLNEVIEINDETLKKGRNLSEVIAPKVFELHNNGEVSGTKIAQILSKEMGRKISKNRVYRILATV